MDNTTINTTAMDNTAMDNSTINNSTVATAIDATDLGYDTTMDNTNFMANATAATPPPRRAVEEGVEPAERAEEQARLANPLSMSFTEEEEDTAPVLGTPSRRKRRVSGPVGSARKRTSCFGGVLSSLRRHTEEEEAYLDAQTTPSKRAREGEGVRATAVKGIEPHAAPAPQDLPKVVLEAAGTVVEEVVKATLPLPIRVVRRSSSRSLEVSREEVEVEEERVIVAAKVEREVADGEDSGPILPDTQDLTAVEDLVIPDSQAPRGEAKRDSFYDLVPNDAENEDGGWRMRRMRVEDAEKGEKLVEAEETKKGGKEGKKVEKLVEAEETKKG